MPTPYRPQLRLSSMKSKWRLTDDLVRAAGGELRTVRRGDAADSVPPVWRSPSGSVRVHTLIKTDSGIVPAVGATIRLVGSPYSGHSSADGYVQFNQLLPGTYLFVATTPLHDAIEAIPQRVPVVARADTVMEANVPLKALAVAAGEVCDDKSVGRDKGVLAGHVTAGDGGAPMRDVTVNVEWTGDAAHGKTRGDGYYRICGVPLGQLLLVKASRDNYMSTTTLTLGPSEIVRVVQLTMKP